MIPPTVTKAQISKIHVLLHQCGMMERKKDLVSGASKGRTDSTKELSMNEARKLIEYLVQFDALQPMRLKVFALAYSAGIIYGDTPEDKKINPVKLNLFLQKQGTVKKPIGSMSKAELQKTINQFEMIVRHTKESGANKAAADATSAMLSEIGIETQPNKPRKRKQQPDSSIN